MANDKREWRSSDNIRSQVAKLEVDQRNIRTEVHTLRETMVQGFKDIGEQIGTLRMSTAEKPTNWAAIGVFCVILGLIMSPSIWMMVRNLESNEAQYEKLGDLRVAAARLDEQLASDRYIRENYTNIEMKELSNQQRGSVKTAIDMNAKAMNAISELRDEFLRSGKGNPQ